MKVVLFYHSFLSCWNHGNAHFLRGIARALVRRHHEVVVYEPADGWSRINALADGGEEALAEAENLVPGVKVRVYRESELDLDQATDGADLVIVHEWNTPRLIAALGRRRASGASFLLMFHDTHHRAITATAEMDALELDGYDGILAFGEVLREIYSRRGWGQYAFTWHEAADTALFQPLLGLEKDADVIWIGNWGDDERSQELETYLINPVARLAVRAIVHGVRYPAAARNLLSACGIAYRGWIANHRTPAAFARARATVHVPRRPYTKALPGIPTIRVFEALACGIPLVCAPWLDEEALFPRGAFLTASSEDAMTEALSRVLNDDDLAHSLAATGLRAVLERHTCSHRVEELLAIVDILKPALPIERPETALQEQCLVTP